MNAQTSKIDKINREACAWIARLHDREPPPEELAALREWMRQSPAHKAELRHMAERWDELNILTELAVPVTGSRRIGKASSLNDLFNRKWAVGALTAAAMLAIVVVFWPPGLIDRNAPASQTYVTAIGEQQWVTLPDDSTVLLNTNSRLRVDYGSRLRNVYLIQGEAHFEVASQLDRPFRVFAGNGMVRAIGTAFSVHLKANVVEVTVTKGSVEINPIQNAAGSSVPPIDTGGSLAVVRAGQSAVFDQVVESVQSIETIDDAEISRKLSWQEGLLRFSGDPLAEVVQEISRYTSLSIVITDPELRDLRIGGFFEVGETAKMFEALERGFGVHVEYVDDNLVHLSRAASATDKP